MSEYTYNLGGRRITVEPALVRNDSIYITAQKSDVPLYGAWIANEDAPTVAAEILKAAGRDDLAGYLTGVAETRPTIAERAAIEAEKKLQERRDALAKRFSKDVNGDYIDYKACGPYTKAAIDSYIELEDGK